MQSEDCDHVHSLDGDRFVSELTDPLGRVGRACGTCVSGGHQVNGRYRDFLLEPGTLFCLASGLRRVATITVHPGGVVSRNEGSARPLFIVAAFTGYVCSWWSATPRIRESYFTADIPVSVATVPVAAIAQFSETAAIAVLLLAGGMVEEFVPARAGNALESLERLLCSETR